MLINWLITCRYAEADGNLAALVGAGTDVLLAPLVPADVEIMLAMRFTLAADEARRPGAHHQLECVVLDPAGQPVRDASGAPTPPLRAVFGAPTGIHQVVPTLSVRTIWAFKVRWRADIYGTYQLQVTTDEDEDRTA